MQGGTVLASAGLIPEISSTPEALFQCRVEHSWLLPISGQRSLPPQKPYSNAGWNTLGFCRSQTRNLFHPRSLFPMQGGSVLASAGSGLRPPLQAPRSTPPSTHKKGRSQRSGPLNNYCNINFPAKSSLTQSHNTELHTPAGRSQTCSPPAYPTNSCFS